MPEPTYDELMTQVARLNSELGHARRGQVKNYEALRKLENKIRNANKFTGMQKRSDALSLIAHYIPIHPRARWSFRR